MDLKKWQMRFNGRLYSGLAQASHYRYVVLLLLPSSSPHIPHWHSTAPAGMEQPCDFSHLHHTHGVWTQFPMLPLSHLSWRTQVLTPKWRDKDNPACYDTTVLCSTVTLFDLLEEHGLIQITELSFVHWPCLVFGGEMCVFTRSNHLPYFLTLLNCQYSTLNLKIKE